MSKIDESVVWKILDNDVTFYVNKNNPTHAYAEYTDPATNAICLTSTTDPYFLAYLGCEYRNRSKSTGRPKFDEFIATKREELLYERKNIVTICRRLSGCLKDKIFYNLADEEGRVVVIDEDGCNIYSCDQLTDFKFETMVTDEPQVEPVGDGDLLTLLRPFVNMGKDSFILFVVCLIQYFSRNIENRKQITQEHLDSLYAQVETAKAELGKPFPQEQEYREKSARLAELNAELNIDDKTPMEALAEPESAIAKKPRQSILAKLKAPLPPPAKNEKTKEREVR